MPDLPCAITKATIAWMDEAIAAKEVFSANFIEMSEYYHKTGEDVIYELFAPSLGLGTCWTGLVETCARSGYQPLLQLLNTPDNLTVTGGIIVGYPQYSFRRLVNRSPLIVTWRPSCDSGELPPKLL